MQVATRQLKAPDLRESARECMLQRVTSMPSGQAAVQSFSGQRTNAACCFDSVPEPLCTSWPGTIQCEQSQPAISKTKQQVPHLNPCNTSFCSFWLMPAPFLPAAPCPMKALRQWRE